MAVHPYSFKAKSSKSVFILYKSKNGSKEGEGETIRIQKMQILSNKLFSSNFSFHYTCNQ